MYTCKICSFTCRYMAELGRHINEKHPEIGEVEYYKKYISTDPNCGICLLCKQPLSSEGTRFKFTSGFRRKIHRKCSRPTKENWILIFGKELGELKWNDYCKKQAISNTLEYKQEKYNWTVEQFDNYNKSRAITLENMIKKYGEIEGSEKYKLYCEKQKDAGCTLKWFTDKYGETDGLIKYKQLNRLKQNTLSNFIIRYGQIDGPIKYKEYLDKHKNFYSIMATNFFIELNKKLKNPSEYFGDNEFGLWNNYLHNYSKYDYTNIITKKIIEFNGERFHPHEKFDENFKNPFNNITSVEAWEKDRKKEQCALDNGFKIFYIWENDVLTNIDTELNKCINFLEGNSEIC